MIEWKPIDEMPDELKNGRQVLLWDDGEAIVGVFVPLGGVFETSVDGWCVNSFECQPILRVTHFAEINPPKRR